MQKTITTITLAIIAAATTFAQNNYAELRGSTTQYGYLDYTRNLPQGWVVEFTHIHTLGQEQVFGGAGRTIKLGESGTINAMLYGVTGTNGELGIMPAVVVAIQRTS